MLLNRIIPCLLLKNQGLVKTVSFKKPIYVGDPINAVKVFNDKEVDELIFLDITATLEKRNPNIDLIKDIASEAFMPFSYGGGINKIDQIKEIFKAGVEKVIINSYAVINPNFIREASKYFGSQSIVVAIDVKKNLFGKYEVMIYSGTRKTGLNPVDLAIKMQALGAGEIFINSINHDGKMDGYDLKLIKLITDRLEIPVIACGGAGNFNHLGEVIKKGGASAAAAGSLFVFYGEHKAVLINYPSQDEIKKIN